MSARGSPRRERDGSPRRPDADHADADKPSGEGGGLDPLGGVDFLATLKGAAAKLTEVASERERRERGCVCESNGKDDPLEVYAFRPGLPPTLMCALWAEIPRVLGHNPPAGHPPEQGGGKKGIVLSAAEKPAPRTAYWWPYSKEAPIHPRNAVEVMLHWLTNQPCFLYPLTQASGEVVGAEWSLLAWPQKDPFSKKPHADYDFKYTSNFETEQYDAIAKKNVVLKNKRAPEYVTQLLLSDTGGPTAIYSLAKDGPLIEPEGDSARACFVWPDGNTLVTFPGKLWNVVLSAKGPGDAPFCRGARFASAEEPRLCLQINWWTQRPALAQDLPRELHSDCATCAFDLAVARTPWHEGGPEPDALVPAGLHEKNMVQRIAAWLGDAEMNVSPTCGHELSGCCCTVEKPPPKGIHYFVLEKAPSREYKSDDDFDDGDYY